MERYAHDDRSSVFLDCRSVSCLVCWRSSLAQHTVERARVEVTEPSTSGDDSRHGISDEIGYEKEKQLRHGDGLRLEADSRSGTKLLRSRKNAH